jgi:hypothetical protein
MPPTRSEIFDQWIAARVRRQDVPFGVTAPVVTEWDLWNSYIEFQRKFITLHYSIDVLLEEVSRRFGPSGVDPRHPGMRCWYRLRVKRYHRVMSTEERAAMTAENDLKGPVMRKLKDVTLTERAAMEPDLQAWLEERCVVAPDARGNRSGLIDNYRRWRREFGKGPPAPVCLIMEFIRARATVDGKGSVTGLGLKTRRP